MSADEFKRSAKLPEMLRQEMLDKLDRQAHADTDSSGGARHNQRKDTRWLFRQSDVAVTVEHPGGGSSRLLVFSRNLSAGGISFLHNGFLYPMSRCKIVLPKLDGQSFAVGGLIVGCRHINGLLHEVGIKFDRRIDPVLFIKPETTPTDAPSSMEVPELHGRVLIVDDSEMDRALLLHHLKMSGIQLTSVTTSGAALDTVKRDIVEIILTELNLETCDGVELIGKIKETAYKGPIVVITAETEPARHEAARKAGADEILAKPYNPNQLYDLMVTLHKKIGAMLTKTVLYSTMDDQPGMVELIGQFIDHARKTARKIEKLGSDENLAEVRQLCLTIKGAAGGYGFNPLSDQAVEAIKALDAAQSVRQASSQLRSLCMLCDRLRLRGPVKPGSQGRDPAQAA